MTRIGTLALLTIITVMIVFSNLGGIPLLDPDEPVYAETPKEMIQFKDYLSPRIYGEYWYDKPPMYYWLVAAAFKLFGVSEFAARFPSALLAVLCVLYVYSSGRRLLGNGTALASALVLATSIEYFYLGKAAVTDITLNLFLTVSLLSFLEKKYYLFYIFAGLATLTKGPIGLLFPSGIVFFYLLFTRNLSELRNMKIPLGIILYALVASPWYVAMYNIHGSAFIETFLGFHNITRFTSPEHPEGVLWYYYIPVLAIGFFPWTPIMVQSVWASVTRSGSDRSVLLFLNIWAAFIFIFFSISQTKLVSYILPMYPALALLAGWYINHLWNMKNKVRPFSWPIMLSIFVLLFVGGLFIGFNTMPQLKIAAISMAALLLLITVAVWYYISHEKIARAFYSQVMGMTVFTIILVYAMFPIVAPSFTSKDVAQQFTANYDGVSKVYVIKFLHPGFTFYTDIYGTEIKTTEQIKSVIQNQEQAYIVLRQGDYNNLSANERQALNIIATVADKMIVRKL